MLCVLASRSSNFCYLLRHAMFNNLCDSQFKLPPRSAVWLSVAATPEPGSAFSSVKGLFPSNSILPILRDAVSIITPLILAWNPSPKINPKKRKQWTAKERLKAKEAFSATSLENLTRLVEFVFVLSCILYLLCYLLAQRGSGEGCAKRRQLC